MLSGHTYRRRQQMSWKGCGRYSCCASGGITTLFITKKNLRQRPSPRRRAMNYLKSIMQSGSSYCLCGTHKTVPSGTPLIWPSCVCQSDGIARQPIGHYGCGLLGRVSHATGRVDCFEQTGPKHDVHWTVVLRSTLIYTVGYFEPEELFKMSNYFNTGLSMSMTHGRSGKSTFGAPPTPEDVIARYVDELMAAKKKEEEEKAAESSLS